MGVKHVQPPCHCKHIFDLSFLSESFPDPEDKARVFLEYSGVCQETLKCSVRYPCYVFVLGLYTGFIFSLKYYIAAFGICCFTKLCFVKGYIQTTILENYLNN